MIKNIWHSIESQSIYRTTKPSKPSPVKPFVPKVILWKAKEQSLNALELQTKLNNEIIKFLNKKV